MMMFICLKDTSVNAANTSVVCLDIVMCARRTVHNSTL